MSEFLAETFVGSMPLDPTDRLFQSPSGLFFECRGIARAVPVEIDKIEVCLDFHVYPIVDRQNRGLLRLPRLPDCRF